MISKIKIFLKNFLKDSEVFLCPICKAKNYSYYNDLCNKCKGDLVVVSSNHCNGCGGEIDGILALCSKCLKEKQRTFLSATTLFQYNKSSRDLILLLKFAHRIELARFLGNIAVENLNNCNWDIDLIVPVPLHWSRRIQRGFNQSELLAVRIGKQLNKPVAKYGLIRVRKAKEQKKLNSVERHKNLKNVFKARGKKLKGKRILLVDDIFTTGATVDNCSIALMKAGAMCVYVLTITRA